MKNKKWTALPLLFSLAILAIGSFASCVTVNVNIPDSAVQQATDDYVKDLYEAKTKAHPVPSPSPSQSREAALEVLPQIALVTEAYADDRTITIHGSEAHDIGERIKARIPELDSLKSQGILGETNEGKLTIKGKIKKGDEKRVWRLVQDENGDRYELYRSVVSHNGLNKGSLETIARNFAHSFQKHSPPGTWIQDDAGTWSRKN